MTAPPVNALAIAENHLGIPIEWVEPAEEDEAGRRRPRARQSSGDGIAFLRRHEFSNTSTRRGRRDRPLTPAGGLPQGGRGARHREQAVRRARKRGLGSSAGADSDARLVRRGACASARVRCARAAREWPARRAWKGCEACSWIWRNRASIAVVDDGVVASRRGNRMPATRKLTGAEQECVERVTELDLPHRARSGEWTAWAWPVPGRPFRRILLRAVPDDV